MVKLIIDCSPKLSAIMNIKELTQHHINGCKIYQQLVKTRFKGKSPEDIYIHSSIFKEKILVTYGGQDLIEYKSSGTSGKPSIINFSRSDAIDQQRLLLKTITPYLTTTKQRLFVEVGSVDNGVNNARRAASRGFSLLGKKELKSIQIQKVFYLLLKDVVKKV